MSKGQEATRALENFEGSVGENKVWTVGLGLFRAFPVDFGSRSSGKRRRGKRKILDGEKGKELIFKRSGRSDGKPRA